MKTTGPSSPNATVLNTHVGDDSVSHGVVDGSAPETIFSSLPPGPDADAFLTVFRSSPDVTAFVSARAEGAQTLQQQFGRNFGVDLARDLLSDRPLRQSIDDVSLLANFEDPSTKL